MKVIQIYWSGNTNSKELIYELTILMFHAKDLLCDQAACHNV